MFEGSICIMKALWLDSIKWSIFIVCWKKNYVQHFSFIWWNTI